MDQLQHLLPVTHIPSSLQTFFLTSREMFEIVLTVPNYVVVLYFQTGEIFQQKQ